MKHESLQLVIATARELIRCEQDFANDAGIDNYEHILRVKRIAETVAAFLEKEGVPTDECAQARNKLIQYGREIFVAVWMQPLDGDKHNPPSEKDAVECFDRILKTRK